eukprot:8066634-Karenia_brevis.AAC.1
MAQAHSSTAKELRSPTGRILLFGAPKWQSALNTRTPSKNGSGTVFAGKVPLKSHLTARGHSFPWPLAVVHAP